ncbi:MAG: SDR family NAD(P)-dependent oxidoreductase [Eggerthellaceae bacterium]|jgi:short-subunit dehydrogenase
MDDQNKESKRQLALITGASSGMGKEYADLLGARGYDLLLVARREEALIDLSAEIERRYHVHAFVYPLDLSKPDAPKKLISYVDSHDLDVEVLINNAGFGHAEPYVDSSLDLQHGLFQVDMITLADLCHEFGGRMKAKRSGMILNIASIAAYTPGPYMTTYYAAKAFVESLSQGLHTELRPYGVHVTALCPGPVNTNFFPHAGFGKGNFFNIVHMPPRTVAREGLWALRHNKTIHLPSLFAVLTVLFARIMPSIVMRGILVALQKRSSLQQKKKA